MICGMALAGTLGLAACGQQSVQTAVPEVVMEPTTAEDAGEISNNTAEEEEEMDFTGWTLLNRGERVGVVTGTEPIPGNLCIYVGETLVPLHPDLIRSADPDKQILDLDLPDGLL